MNGKNIRAVYTDTTIRVYQAFSPVIAEQAVRLGTFGGHFKLDRMTWIKPSFLWMMYRCGWATKDHQERVLAVDITREGFDFAVTGAVRSSYSPAAGITYEEWQELIARSDIRVQWDPERDVDGRPLGHRSIQLGLRGDAVRRYVSEWITGITDITEYVTNLDAARRQGADITSLLPEEKIYPMPSEAAQ